MRPLVRAWKAAAASAGVVLLAPSCPRALACTGSWWQWLDGSGHDPDWLGAQIDAVSARFAIDPRRIYATGYSGGATYLGWYVPSHGERFAAVAHVAGGAAYRPPCPACKVPVLFLLGATDPMIGPYARPLRDWYATCGDHEIVWETLPGVTHESILGVLQAGRARGILDWLLARPASCAGAPPLASFHPGGGTPGLDTPDGAAPDPGPPLANEPPSPPVEAAPRPPPLPPARSGCACRVAAPAPAPTTVLAASLVCLAASRRRRRSPASLGSRAPR